MIQQIGRKIKVQMHKFSGELSAGLGKVSSRFVEEMLFGISASGSVRLSSVARTLDEPISMHDTHKRLSRNLADKNIRREISAKTLEMGAKRINKDSLLIVDPSDLTKKYAKKMEYLADVRDGSEQNIARGYWLCEVMGAEVGSSEITPLAQTLWSQEAPDYVSENHEVLSIVGKALAATDYKGILVYDRGGDRRVLYEKWAGNPLIRFIIRQRGDRNLVHKGGMKNTLQLAENCKTPYASTIIKEKDGKEKVHHIQFGFVPVRLPEHPERSLWLVVVKGFGKTPLMLLTTEPMRRNRKTLWWIVEAYLTRWKIEETIRFIKQSYNFEDVRVMTYGRLQNMAAITLAVGYFAAVWLGQKAKLEILAMHAMEASKRIFGVPNFRYYALADGIKVILTKVGNGILDYEINLDLPIPQFPLFDP